MEREGLNDRRGKRFTRRHLADLIRSKCAIGRWRVRDLEDPSRWVEIDIPAVIDQKSWEAANAYLAQKAQHARSDRSRHLLTGLVYCGQCGARMGPRPQYSRRGKPLRHVYGCYRRIHRTNPDYKAYCGSNCTMPYLPKEELEESVWNEIEALLSQPERLFDSIQDAERIRDERDERSEIESLKREISKIKLREGRYLDLAVDSRVSEDIYRNRIKDLTTRRQHLEKQLKAAEKRQTEQQNTVIRLQDLTSYAGTIKDRMESLSLEEKREIVRLFFAGDENSRIVVHANNTATLHVEIDFDQLLGRRSNHAALCYEK